MFDEPEPHGPPVPRQFTGALALAFFLSLLAWLLAEAWEATEPQAPSGRGGEVVRQRGVSSNGVVYGQ
jgi:hypothetical protein